MSRHSLALLAIVIVGVCIRVTYTITTGHSQEMASRSGQVAHDIVADGHWFARNARAEAYILTTLDKHRHGLIDPASIDYTSLDRNGRWFPEISQSVGVSVVLAGIWAITGDERYVQPQIFQGILDGLTVLLVYWIAMQLFKRRRPAMIAAALYAIYPPLAWQTADPYNDIWAVDFTILIVAIYLVVLKSTHPWRWLIVCGLCEGIGAYFRPQVLLIAPVIALATVATTGRREALRRIVITTVLASLLLVPWTIRNYNDFHTFIPTRSGFWQTMMGGLEEIPDSFGRDLAERPLIARIHRVRPDLVPETPAWDSYLKHYLIRAIEQHPLAYVETLAHRVGIATVLMYDHSWMHRGVGHMFAYKGGMLAFIVNRPFDVLQEALEPSVFLLAMFGLGLTWRRWKRQHTILVALVLSVLLPYMAIHVEARYLLPAVFAYFIWIGLAVDHLIERIERRPYRVPAKMGLHSPATHQLCAQRAPLRLNQPPHPLHTILGHQNPALATSAWAPIRRRTPVASP